ncbi:DUF4224 domain-containing protein [Glaciimonas immobilis]|uniref:DUF4224 domain-containing protein n=1 Tax=Glaciimonas immobilis TaxID=728004 RepID=A0A840RWJ0_9BURK|nr:DUF4224 domain-containing protein [Glaciimonas immobilis]KAF3997493.1 DUF4224 domain-containing protein [Glaciimonas immobilis]MBB5200830.1 hypothetical protein [Glaciimonas immobilis]
MNIFLDDDDIATLTGRKMKGGQIDALRKMGLPFFVNATGHPVVAKEAIHGRKEIPVVKSEWIPKALRSA